MKVVITCIAAAAFATNVHALAVFHVGNSLTDQAYGIVDIAVAKGYSHFFGRHMIPGAPLEWLADHKCEGMMEPTSLGGCADAILAARSWDAVVLQHRQRSIANDVEHARVYMDAAYRANPNCQAYFFQEYPYPREGDYVTKWSGSDPNVEHTRLATQARADALSAVYPGRKPCLVVPMGDVMYAIFKGIKDGKPFPEVTQPADLFADADHFNDQGKYLEAVTHFATIYKKDPANAPTSGLRFWSGPYSVSQAYAQAIWRVVWDVVKAHPRTGISSTPALRLAAPSAHASAGAAEVRAYSLTGRMVSGHAPVAGVRIIVAAQTAARLAAH